MARWFNPKVPGQVLTTEKTIKTDKTITITTAPISPCSETSGGPLVGKAGVCSITGQEGHISLTYTYMVDVGHLPCENATPCKGSQGQGKKKATHHAEDSWKKVVPKLILVFDYSKYDFQ